MLEYLRTMLGIEANDTDQNERLSYIITGTTERLKVLIGGIEPPTDLDYIIREVSIKRFNRIGSEGLTMHVVEGENLHFADNDFDEFREDIETWLESQKETTRGKVRFL